MDSDLPRYGNAKLAGILLLGAISSYCTSARAGDCTDAGRVYAVVKNKGFAILNSDKTVSAGNHRITVQSRGAFYNCSVSPADPEYVMKHNTLSIDNTVISYTGWLATSIEITGNKGTITERDDQGRLYARPFTIAPIPAVYQSRRTRGDEQ